MAFEQSDYPNDPDQIQVQLLLQSLPKWQKNQQQCTSNQNQKISLDDIPRDRMLQSEEEQSAEEAVELKIILSQVSLLGNTGFQLC